MKQIICITLTIFMSLSAVVADSAEDAKAIQGSWVPAKAELGGQPMPDAVLKTISLKLEDGKYDVSVGGHPDIVRPHYSP